MTNKDKLKLSCFDYEMVAYILSLNFTISLQIPFLLFRLTRPLLCFTTISSTRRRSKQLIAAKSKHFCGELTTPTHTHPVNFKSLLACLYYTIYPLHIIIFLANLCVASFLLDYNEVSTIFVSNSGHVIWWNFLNYGVELIFISSYK